MGERTSWYYKSSIKIVLEYLSKREENFCENAGLFGVLITIACLAQHLYFMIPNLVTFAIIGVYLFCITAFVLLMKKQPYALVLLAISTGLVLLIEIIMMISLAFSLVLIILWIYLLVITIIGYTSDLPDQLKKNSIEKRKEEEAWRGII